MIFVKHKGGGSLAFSHGGEMTRLFPGDTAWIPIEIYEAHKNKLEPIEAFRRAPVVTGQLLEVDAVLPRWKLKLTPEEYLKKYGDNAKNSELAQQLLEAG